MACELHENCGAESTEMCSIVRLVHQDIAETAALRAPDRRWRKANLEGQRRRNANPENKRKDKAGMRSVIGRDVERRAT